MPGTSRYFFFGIGFFLAAIKSPFVSYGVNAYSKSNGARMIGLVLAGFALGSAKMDTAR